MQNKFGQYFICFNLFNQFSVQFRLYKFFRSERLIDLQNELHTVFSMQITLEYTSNIRKIKPRIQCGNYRGYKSCSQNAAHPESHFVEPTMLFSLESGELWRFPINPIFPFISHPLQHKYTLLSCHSNACRRQIGQTCYFVQAIGDIQTQEWTWLSENNNETVQYVKNVLWYHFFMTSQQFIFFVTFWLAHIIT